MIDSVLTDVKELKVGIVESNINYGKHCLIPIAICDKAQQFIKNVKVFNSFNYKD